ncbi:outer membrane lipoprotein-sorting protein [Permianibacter aggregans]|uniref:Outer membrane lipoprotein-sorting protein n=1 Tax=Permianibacter aggregans TaxID=1510150 RepID=A0A4R6UVJ9_9GAMM|nr:outer membrane lipoprotein-sorting protein [Permianibacter aggregans]QGX40395.1 outer membrane lipoprotein-sorting protein [Permianibacter aggregans]TDQ49475.1 outer membrane lipoprotein-sorting protein [Permianibacter aggregans]
MKKLLPNWVNVALTSALLALAIPAHASAEKGLEIAKEMKARDIGWGDSQAEMKMILTNKQGESSEREIRIQSLEVQQDGDKSLSIFDSPQDVKGTAFLSFSHAVGDDEQWLFLPALSRVKRISSSNKSGPFMGSEFAYEDLTSFEVPKYTYNYLRDENINGLDAYVIETIPVDKNSGYTRRVVWVDKAHYRVQKIEFYDRRNALLKTLTMTDYQQYLDKYWRPLNMLMVNHQTGKKTELNWSNFRFNTGLKDEDFNQNTLKRAR